jgi:hypothetical protein
MYVGIEGHKRYLKLPVRDELGEIGEEVRVEMRPSMTSSSGTLV